MAWVYSPHSNECYPIAVYKGTTSANGRVFGVVGGGNLAQVDVTTADGSTVLFNGSNTGDSLLVDGNLLHWPSPLASASYV